MLSNVRIPSLIAVPLWIGSALAVMGYTYLAFKETADGVESAVLGVEESVNPLVASAAIVTKPLERERFKKSKK